MSSVRPRTRIVETPAQKCVRWVTALEDLADQEAASVRARDFAAVASIQERAAELVAQLAAKGPEVADAALRQRIAAILTRREDTAAWLETQLAATRQQLESLDSSKRRVAKIAPVYGGRPAGGSSGKLRAIG